MSYWNDRNFGMIAAQGNGSFGLTQSGEVLTNTALAVSGWANIVQVAGINTHVLGLTSDGVVLTAGSTNYMPTSGLWGGVVQIAVGLYHSLGVKSDGTVFAKSQFTQEITGVTGWTDIAQVAAGNRYSLGLKSDGTVIGVAATPSYIDGIDTWSGIIQISGGYDHVVGLRADGTVVGAGTNSQGQITGLDAWTDVVQVAAGRNYTAALRADGSVVCAGNFNSVGPVAGSSFSEALQIAAGDNHILGLLANGQVVAEGNNSSSQVSIPNTWTDISTGQYYDINGITSIDGTPISMEVRAHEANAGGLLFKTQSDANGEYTLRLPRWYTAYVMAIPPAGHRPMCHGPITKPDDIQV